MPKFSPELDMVPDYPFPLVARACNAEEKKSEEKGRLDWEVTRLTIGNPDRDIPAAARKELISSVRENKSTRGYPIDMRQSRGIPGLIDAIRQLYKDEYGTNVTAEQIVVTGWTKPVLQDLATFFPKGYGLTPTPVYPAHVGGIILAGLSLKTVPCDPSPDALPEIKLKPSDSVMYFCDPWNPKDTVAPIEYYQSLVDKFGKYNTGLIRDGAYMNMKLDPKVKPVSLTQVPELMAQGYEVVSLSKSHNFAGLGCGWVVSTEENMQRFMKYWDRKSQGVQYPIQKAALCALTDDNARKETKNYMAALNRRGKILSDTLNEMGMECSRPRSTPYVWFKTPEGISDTKFVFDIAIPKAHVGFTPGSYLGDPSGRYVRAVLYQSEGKIVSAMNRLKSALKG